MHVSCVISAHQPSTHTRTGLRSRLATKSLSPIAQEGGKGRNGFLLLSSLFVDMARVVVLACAALLLAYGVLLAALVLTSPGTASQDEIVPVDGSWKSLFHLTLVDLSIYLTALFQDFPVGWRLD